MGLEDTAQRAGHALVRASVRTVDAEARLRELPGLRRQRARARAAVTVACLAVVVVAGVGLGSRTWGWPGLEITDLGPALPSPSSPPVMPAPADEPLAQNTAEALQAALDAWVAGGNGIGVTAAVVTADGSWQGAAGRDGAGRALQARSAMGIGQVTSSVVAAEVVGLSERGAVDLDAPIADYARLPFDARGATVRQVLGMRSGFPPDPREQILAAAGGDPDRSWTSGEVLGLVDSDGARLGTVGDLYYNDLNSIALGRLVEQVTGTTLAEALRRDLLAPAGLARMWVQDAERPEPPLAVGTADSGSPPVDPDGPWLPSRAVATALGPAGAMAADAPTLARWGYLLYGGHVLDATAVVEMTSGGPDDWYGLGTGRLPDSGPIRNDGGTAVGHDSGPGPYTVILLVWPHRQLAIAVMTPEPAQPPLDTSTTLEGLLEQVRVIGRAADTAPR